MSDIDVRVRILDEALRLFAHHGYGSTSVRELAHAAGVTKPTLYYHFGSKEGIFRALVQRQLDGLQELVDAILAEAGSPAERLRTFARAYLLGGREHLDAVRFMITCSVPVPDAESPSCSVVTGLLDRTRPLAQVIRQGVDAGELRADLDAEVAILTLVGALNLQLLAALEGTPVDEATVDAILDTWLRGVAA